MLLQHGNILDGMHEETRDLIVTQLLKIHLMHVGMYLWRIKDLNSYF